jgi:hypothetical protein
LLIAAYLFFLLAAWVSADAATLFTALRVFLFDRSFDAFDATDDDVRSFFAIDDLPLPDL